MLSILWQRTPEPAEREHRAHTAFGGPIAPEILAGAPERWGVRLVDGYGSTESGLVAYQPRHAQRPGSFGKAIPEYEVDLFDEDGQPVPIGAIGEIVTRPRRPHAMMSGYHGMPEKTIEAWRELWLHTGDMGRRDADGYLYFVDRKKDAIRRRGENISSTELEQALLEHDDVTEAAVVAVPSELGEDDVKACIVLRDEAVPDPGGFLDWCERRLPRFMVPRYVEIMRALPKTPTQRVEKYRLRDHARNAVTWDREHGDYLPDGNAR
jgi:crotonobetaine/carnitine-CoA ligase